MAQKVIIILNAPVGESLSVEGIQYDLEQQGHLVELVEDTLQANNYTFQPLAYALQEDAELGLENSGYEATERLIDIVSRGAVDNEVLQEAIPMAISSEIDEGFDEEDLEDDEDDEEEE